MNNGKFAAMTVNERLFEANIVDQFDDAVNHRNRSKLVGLLVSVELSCEQANQTIDAIFANPTLYGYSD